MKYTIEIYYRTGDSFGSEDCTDKVGMSWEDIENAKVALVYIKEHYDAYKKQEKSYSSRATDQFEVSEVEDKPWFIKEDWNEAWKYGLNVFKDDESVQRIHAFWCGYFEEMYSAEIKVEEDPSMKIEFR